VASPWPDRVARVTLRQRPGHAMPGLVACRLDADLRQRDGGASGAAGAGRAARLTASPRSASCPGRHLPADGRAPRSAGGAAASRPRCVPVRA
jgi:hypothetical protein